MIPSNPADKLWHVGQTIFESFTITHAAKHPFYGEYQVSRQGWPETILVKSPHRRLLSQPGQQQSFRKKIDSWVALGLHPHLETCYAPVPGDDNAYFLERIGGQSLQQWLSGNSWSLRGALSIAIQLCHGLEYLHRRNITLPHLSSRSVWLTSHSLLKIRDIYLPGHEVADPREDTSAKQKDIQGVGNLLWEMLADAGSLSENKGLGGQPSFRDAVLPYAHVLSPLVKRCLAAEAAQQFKNISAIRHAINYCYNDIFGIDCPYYHLHSIELQAAASNNTAVFLFEQGKFKEGLDKLHQALNQQDRLAEAVYNLLVYKLRSGQYHPQKIDLMIEAAHWHSSLTSHLEYLQSLVRKVINGDALQKVVPPPFLLCPSPHALFFYRRQKDHADTVNLVESHLTALRYEASHSCLLRAWRKKNFEKDTFLAKMYDQLLVKSDKKEIVAVQRFATISGSDRPLQHMVYVVGTRRIAESRGEDKIILRHYGRKNKVVSLSTSGHKVSGLAVSPDGKNIAAATESGTLFLWKTGENKKKMQSPAHRARITSLDFNDDGRFLASGGADGALVVRTVSTGREKFVPIWKKQHIRQVAFFPGGFDLVVAGNHGEIQIWASRGRKCLHSLNGHNGPVLCLTVSPSGDFFATSGKKHIRIWDRYTGACLQEIPGHLGVTTSLLLLEDNRHLVSAGLDDMVKIWDLTSAEMVQLLDGRGKGIQCLAKGSKPHFFFSGGRQGEMVIWKIIYTLAF